MRRLAVVLAVAALAAAVGLVAANARNEKAPTRVFKVVLVGEAESPAGDPVATGNATIRVRRGKAQVCYSIAARDLSGPAVAAHIHRGVAGVEGPVVIPLKTPNAAGKSSGCAKASKKLVNAIFARPARYYVNVHTDEFPSGAIRAQLVGSRPKLGTILHLQLHGTSEPNATGSAVLRIRADVNEVCYRLHAANVTLPTIAAHIHKGAASVNGPVVVPFTAPGANGESSGCTASTAAIVGDILANKAGYYVNVHTKEHPAGAIRSQLGS
jgi:CHRD domain-containing protein